MVQANTSHTLTFFVNGKKIEDNCVDPDWTLLRYLRDKLLLPGTKLGCAEGGCGACTVMISKIDSKSGFISHFTANACLFPVAAIHGLAVTTVEGIGSTKTKLHPVQERLAKAHGSQCGFCTPGMVMSMYTLLRNNPNPSMEEIEDSLVGNLCRCTGYRPILEGFRTFVNNDADASNGCGRSDCCQLNGRDTSTLTCKAEVHKIHQGGQNCVGEISACNELNEEIHLEGEELDATTVLFDPKSFAPYDPSQDIIFPPELKLNPSLQLESKVFRGGRTTFYRTSELRELLQLKLAHPEAKIVCGNTEIGVEVKYKNQHYPVIINPVDIPELLRIDVKKSYVEVGTAVTLTRIELVFKELMKQHSNHKAQVLRCVADMIKWFAGRQIRNVATLGGNIMTGSPISDLTPICMVAGVKLRFQSISGEREVGIENFYTGYRQNSCENNEVLISIKIPFIEENEYFMAYKQARRRDDDIAIVNSAMKVVISPGTTKVDSISLAFGGMAPTVVMAKQTMEKLKDLSWDGHLLEEASKSLLEELNLPPSAPGGMIDYRKALTVSFFFKFFLHVRQELSIKCPDLVSPLREDEKELIKPYRALPAKSMQFFQNVPEGQDRIDPVGRPLAHVSALKQATGEATYVDDMPSYKNELYAAIVTSTRSKAKILSIDESKAMEMENVEGFFCAKDLSSERNIMGIGMDEEIFASNQVGYVGQVIGIVVASDQLTAQRAAKLIKVMYEDIPNPVITIEDAIEADSFWRPWTIDKGNVEEGFLKSDHILEGEIRLGGQEHFYLETNSCLAIPHEEDEMELICSTQDTHVCQKYTAKVLGIPENRVTCKVKRIGGGFGGKEARVPAIMVPIAFAASRLRRPVRIMLDREEDMVITGGRHPFLGRWKVGFQKDGTIKAVQNNLYSNAGYSLDLSMGVIQRAVLSSDNAYNIEHMKITGQCCKTNLPPNTAFRGFGGPQGMFVMEDVITRVAEFLQVDPKIARERNFYSDGSVDHTPAGQLIENCTLRRCWNEILANGNYENRRKAVDEFNKNNEYRKRGLSVVPTQFGICFGLTLLNQAGALLLVYDDGSILLSIGGMEMGQGLYTKMLQVASKALQVPIHKIYIAESSTDKVPNSSATAASVSSDLNGMAVLDACEKLLSRLKPYQKKLPDGKWEDWITAAYCDRVSLSATGFYKTPDIRQYNFDGIPGMPFNYFCFGAALSEVEVDCLTGDHTVLRTDIVMDVGNSLNPAIDIGQIEGAFAQGYGLFTLEELKYSPEGALLTKGPGTYKIPTVLDIPREFNVSLLRNSGNPRAVFSSKAVGEPPLFLAVSVYHAIREAVKSTHGKTEGKSFRFDSPATAERIRMACKDSITQKVQQISEAEKGSFKPWSISV